MVSVTELEAQLNASRLEIAQLRTTLALLEHKHASAQALLRACSAPVAAQAEAGLLTYLEDGLATWGKNISFMLAPRFVTAYQRGITSGHNFGEVALRWRVAVACWAAWHAARLAGDFVECGTNTGILSLAVCAYLDFNRTQKSLWLFDTFAGVPRDQMSEAEQGREQQPYQDCFAVAQRNFAPFPRVSLVRGKVPETLSSVDIETVCYLAIDMNIEYPERAALAHFWPKLVPGGIVVLDDYAWFDHEAQKESHDAFAKSQGVEILALPTGQGLLIKS